MTLVTYLVRAELRRRWRAWLAVVLLIAVGGGASIFAISAWQRTSTAMDRFLEEYRPSQAVAVGADLDRQALVDLPAIEEADSGEYFFLAPHGPDGEVDTTRLGDVNPFSSAYGRAFVGTMNNARILEGRAPDPAAELETVVDEELAEAYDLRPGDTFRVTGISPSQFDRGSFDVVPDGPTFDLEVTGMMRRPSDVVPAPGRNADVLHLGTRDLILTPAFHEAHYRKDLAGGSYFDEEGSEYMELLLAPGATPEELQAQVAEVAPEVQVFLDPGEDTVAAATADRAVRLQAAAALAVGVIGAVVSALFLLLALSRLLTQQAQESAPLRAAGLSPGALRAVTVATTVATTALGAIGAVALSVALSPLGPVGLARRAEPDPGVRVDVGLTALGALAVVAVALAIAIAVASRLGRPDREAPTAGVARLAAQSNDPALATGLRFAGRRSGGRAATQLTVLAACLAVLGSVTFAASASATVDEPERFGWGWELSIGNPNDGELYERLLAEVPRHPAVGAATAVHNGGGGALEYEGQRTTAPLVATEALVGSIRPRVDAGRLPSGPEEVAIGAVTARQLDAGIGDRIQVTSEDYGDGEPLAMTVTGIATFNESLLASRVGEGTLVDRPAFDAMGFEPFQGVVLVDPPAGTTTTEARAALRDDFGRVVATAIVPGDLDALDRVRSLPLLVAAFVGVLAVGTLAFTLGSSLRTTRREVAVLKAMGLRPAQARRAVLVQALALVALPALVGTALGVAAGRLAWGAVATGLGLPDLPVVPLAWVLAAVPAALLAAAVIAVHPALSAARTAPSTTLRAE